MDELRTGLWHWQAPHPDWSPSERWPREVSAYAIDDGPRLLLIDPVGVPAPLLELAGEREVVVVLTAPWHERDAPSLVPRLEAAIVTPPADTADDLVRKFGLSREQAGDGSPDLAWLRADQRLDESARVTYLRAGDHLPIGLEAHLGREENDLVLWAPAIGALFTGDTLVDFGSGFEVNRALRGGVTRDAVVGRLRPLLDLPIELVLPAHGKPVDKRALELALA